MSLFPAYAKAKGDETDEEEPIDGWLKNSSFDPAILSLNVNPNVDSKTDSGKKPKRTKTKLHKSKKSKPELPLEKTSDLFKIDTTRTKEYLNVDTISRPSVPLYKSRYSIFNNSKFKAGATRKFKRYFKIKFETEDKGEREEAIRKSDLDKNIGNRKDVNYSGFDEETKLSKTTEEFNKKLAVNPTDVPTWIEYARFQDQVYEFEKNHKKGSIAKGTRVTADRKLAILDRALAHSPRSEALHRERLDVCRGAYPSDELYLRLKKLVERDRVNATLWQGCVESRQCSMSQCAAPAVLALYSECLGALREEDDVLRMLYQCGLFLKQGGLFEQLWTLLRSYLELNLSRGEGSGVFRINSETDETELVRLEEAVLGSRLPLHELWLRVEKLREACRWTPYSGDGVCEDPQRTVFPEDVNELIHPIAAGGNAFKMTVIVLTLLKIPLLPCRHTTMESFGLDYVPWALDSIESILPIFLRTHWLDLSSTHFLGYTRKLTVGPQYLKPFPGQEEYLAFVLGIISECMNSMEGSERTALGVWLLRFHRVLVALEKLDFVKTSKSMQKKLKKDRKDLLRNCANEIAFYVEYSLIEYEFENSESFLNILTTTLKTHQIRNSIHTIPDEKLKSCLCYVYKTLIDFYFKTDDRDKCLQVAVRLALGLNLDQELELSESSICEADLKFKHVTLKLFQNQNSVTKPVDQFLPNFFVAWISSNMIFVYYAKGFQESMEFFEGMDFGEKRIFEKEVITEFYVSLIFNRYLLYRSAETVKKLEEALYRCIGDYPNNVFFLGVLSKFKSMICPIGRSFSKLKSLSTKTGHSLPNLFLILTETQRLKTIEETWSPMYTGDCSVPLSGLKNKILSLFRALTSPGMCTRRCGLIWRLYLQFLYENYDATVCRNAYYSAVEECPWLKALYIDAAVYIPAELPQIQDLLIEKQLRLHVTPEELDILRD